MSQLGHGLCLSPQRLRGHKALEIKGLFPRKHVVHGPACYENDPVSVLRGLSHFFKRDLHSEGFQFLY
jgi:hypothetical protein